MSIKEKRQTPKYLPIEELTMETESGAELVAVYNVIGPFKVFKVALDSRALKGGFIRANYWHFDEEACREAAEFFTRLADDLKERGA